MASVSVSATTVRAVMTNELALHVGEEAWVLLENESFQDRWDTIYETCPWATVFQSRPFVTSWYRVYRDRFSPIIVTATNGSRLIGLLTLTATVSSLKAKKGRIVGAGKYDAAYQIWLAEEADGESFIKAALLKVKKQFPGFIIHLRHVSGSAPLNWVNEPYWRNRCILETNRRPLMEMNDPALSKMYHKTAFRNCTNRLKKLGPIQFERITTREQLASVFDELKVMYDFRQGAMFNLNQFKDDPLKAEFIWTLFDQGLLYFTVLKVKEQLFATVSGVAEKGWLYFAGSFITHSPFRAKYYSPGFLQILLLSQMMTKDGMTVLDLTAGGDFYKNRLATKYDEVYDLLIPNNRFYRVKRRLRYKYLTMIEKAGKWPMGAMLAMKKRTYLFKARVQQLKRQGIISFVGGKINRLISPPKDKVYAAYANALASAVSFPVNKNNLNDMLCFEAKGTWMSRWEFLEDAMDRYENGENSYTYCEDGRMLGCVWIAEKQEANREQNTPAADKRIQLHHVYCHPLGQAKQKEFLAAVAAAVAKEGKIEMLYALASDKDKALCRTLETIGFKSAEMALSNGA